MAGTLLLAAGACDDGPAPGAESADRRAGPAGDPGAPASAGASAWAAGDEWPTYGGDPGHRRYSALTGLDTLNVHRLRSAWTHHTEMPDVHESTPLVVDGGLYVTTPVRGGRQGVLRLDPATGRRAWATWISLDTHQEHPVPANRGVAVAEGRVFLATADARVVALDAATGDRLWTVRTAPADGGHGHKQAPLVHDGRIYLGISGGPFGIRGWVKAFDADDGSPLWTWHSIPSPAEGGWWGEWRTSVPAPEGGRPVPLPRELDRERSDSARYAGAWERGGGAVWMTPALDSARDLLFVGVGNPAPELNGRVRPGDNRWTVSVCAIRAGEGSTAWCSQYLPHDLWGLDAASPPFLLTLPGDGGSPIPAVGHFSKLGVFFAWHREKGELLVRSESYVPRENFLARPTEEGVRMAPGIYGGTEWSPAAYHPGTGLAYAANVHLPGRYFTRGPDRPDAPPPSVGFDADFGSAAGNVVALDPATGEIRWRRPTPRPMVGGVTATAGGLVFTGRLDGGLMALHARTGEVLWRGEAGTGCASAPVTYRADGRQYVAVTCGGHFLGGGSRGDVVRAFALPDSAAASGDGSPAPGASAVSCSDRSSAGEEVRRLAPHTPPGV